jgi:hypothetical protein
MIYELLKAFGFGIIVLAICSAGAFATYHLGKYYDDKIAQEEKIENFEDCVKAGDSAVSSSPLRCIDRTRNVFVKEIP